MLRENIPGGDTCPKCAETMHDLWGGNGDVMHPPIGLCCGACEHIIYYPDDPGIPSDEPRRVVPTRDWLGTASSEIFDALYPGLLPAGQSGKCIHGVSLTDSCDLCLKVSEINGGDSGVPSESDAPVLVECMHCPAMVETRTGCAGIDDALSQAWEIDGAGDLVCPSCAESRADLIGEESGRRDACTESVEPRGFRRVCGTALPERALPRDHENRGRGR